MSKKATRRIKPEKNVEVSVPQSFMRKVADTYSADVIAIDNVKKQSKIRSVFAYEGTERVCVATGSKDGLITHASTYQVVEPDAYTGKTTTYLDPGRKLGYEGMLVHFKGRPVVLTNKVTFVYEKKAKLPCGSLDLSKATSAIVG